MCNVCEGGEGVPGKPNIRHNCYPLLDLHLTGYLFCFHFCLFAISWAAPAAYGGSQARGIIIAVATQPQQLGIPVMSATYTTAHGNTGLLTH